MKIATILPSTHLDLARDDDYLMALAHVVREDRRYRKWFRDRSRGENPPFILLDNGAAELGAGLDIRPVIQAAFAVGAHEVVLPDVVFEIEDTLTISERALRHYADEGLPWTFMAVPQGRTFHEWKLCLTEMLTWPVQSIGISRFVAQWDDSFSHRGALLQQTPELIDSGKEIHLLGCPGDPREAFVIEEMFPGRIRGIDSGIAAIYAQVGRRVYHGPKPPVEFDFQARTHRFDTQLLMDNVSAWCNRVEHGEWMVPGDRL